MPGAVASSRGWMLATLLGFVVLLGSSIPRAQADAPLSSQHGLVARIGGLVDAAGLGDGVGISVVNLVSGREVYGLRSHTPLNPASNMKLITAAAALSELGGDFQMRTGLYGHQQGDAIVGGLYLKSFADPTLSEADILGLAQQLVRRGIRKVDEVIVDGSYFDDQVLPPAFEQQPDEVAPFRAAIGAVAVDRSAYTLRVLPGKAPGDKARVELSGEGYFDVENLMTTAAGGVAQVVAIQRDDDDRLSLKLRGSVPMGITGVSYRRRVASPLHYAGHVLVDALKALRVQVPRRAALGVAPPSAALLAYHDSPPLSEILCELGKHSDNFVAEMLLKVLGAEQRRPGSSAAGVQVVKGFLKLSGVPLTQLELVNGSGLFDGNRVAPAHLTHLLGVMYARPGVRAEYVAQLAVGGVDGTLRNRLQHLPVPRVVRAKTGTLSDVIALSGYVLGPTPERAFAFSFLANGVRGKHHAARALADDIVQAIASHLHAAQ